MKILENGLDSFSKSISLLNGLPSKERDEQYEFLLKDIIINLHHSTETLFKYLIQKKDKYLIYSEPGKVFKQKIENKFKSTSKQCEFQTIQFIEAIYRVIVLYDIDLGEDELNNIKLLNDIRNNLTHYEWEFKDELAEHTIALLLPILFKIYSKYISQFNKYAIDKGFYIDTKKAINNIEIWNLKRIIEINKKIDKAFKRMKFLDANPKEKGKIIKDNETNIQYIECPICKNKKFKANGNLIIANENIGFIGKCKYCDMSIENQDAQFISLNFSSNYDRYLGVRRRYIIDMFRKVLTATNVSTEYESEFEDIKDIFKSNLDLSREVVIHILLDTIDRLDEFIAQSYFEEKVYFLNDVSEDIIENKSSLIELEGKHLYNQYKDTARFVESFRNMYKVIKNYLDILNDVNEEKELYNKLKRYKYSLSYHNGMYHNFNGEEIESEITIQINFDFDEYKKYLLKNKQS